MASSSDHSLIKMAALGRPFQLGNLYDYRNDRIIQGKLLSFLSLLT